MASFDLCAGMVIDVTYMYCVFLGVMEKSLTGFWFGVTCRGSPFSTRKLVMNDPVCSTHWIKLTDCSV